MKGSAETAGRATPRKYFAARSVQDSARSSWRRKRVENGAYVFWIRRLNPVGNVRVVNGRSSGRYVVRGFGFCDLDSPDVFRWALISRRAIVIKLVLIGSTARTNQNTDANLPTMLTNLCQRRVELILLLPLNICRGFILTSNLHRVGYDAWD